jgi:predicted transcriptional regulator YdeE
MTKQIFTAFIGMALAFNQAPAKAASAPENQLHQLQKQINEGTKTTQQWETAMHTISVETGVPRDQLRTLRQNYPTIEPSAVLIACVLADETKKAPEAFLKQHIAGQTWVQIARNNKVPLDKIDERLQRIQQALAAGAATPGGKAGAKQ